MMKTVLFVSPHLDDAVFSCAGMIRYLVTDGWKVIVATVFTEGGDEHVWRRTEDLDAARLLGFEAVHLGFPDAPFRQPGHGTYEEILFGWNALDDAMVERLRTLISGWQADLMFGPLGVGEHVDHRIVFEAVRHVDGVEFYEERPYAYARGAAEVRLRRLGVPLDFDEARLLADWRDLPFVRLYSAGEGLLPSSLDATEIMAADPKLLRADIQAACEASQCYKSQYQAFCGDAETHDRLERQHGFSIGGTEERWERTWVLRKAGNDIIKPQD